MTYSSLLRNVYKSIVPDHVRCLGTLLPAKHLRLGGKEFKDDRFFLASARAEAKRLQTHCGLTAGTRVLDVGCGVGRLPIGLLAEFGEISGYHGIDVDPGCIDWCRRHIQQSHPGFLFTRIDVRNERYNPQGSAVNSDFRLPFEGGSFDVVCLYSVFSHMTVEEIKANLKEFHRLMAPNGTLFMTAFVERGVTEVSENPSGYQMEWSGPLHCVRYEKEFFQRMLRDDGFRINRFDYGQETDGQSALYCNKIQTAGQTART